MSFGGGRVGSEVEEMRDEENRKGHSISGELSSHSSILPVLEDGEKRWREGLGYVGGGWWVAALRTAPRS